MVLTKIFIMQIRLQIKRNVARTEGSKTNFTDRNVDDVGDGYVACESYQDTHEWVHVAEMERAMQVCLFLFIVFISGSIFKCF